MGRKAFESLTETMFYVLMAFLHQERCGTEVVDFVEQKTCGRLTLGPGTLYTILSRFEAEGFVEETAVEGRKRTYRLTDRGLALYDEELDRLRRCVADGDSERRYL